MRGTLSSFRSRVSLGLRALAVFLVLCWGWYILAQFRTQRFGFSFEVLGIAALFVMPATILPFLGLRPGTVGMGGVALLVATMALSEGLAGFEESRFRREQAGVATESQWVCRDRRWPFSHHSMMYHPQSGRFFGSD